MKGLVVLMFLSFGLYAKNPPLDTVKYVEINKYLGKWYEIASIPQKFQKGCTATSANYSLRADGDIKVVNSCRLGNPKGELKSAEARGWIKDTETNAKLKVQFFLTKFKISFLAGNYWILDLGEDYEYALVGDKSRKYFWILSRTNKMDEGLYEELLARAKDMHFDTSQIVKTIH
ncbi:lipocalin family protein [bacterium]|nr:lipocalin family protein [bacterium]